MRRDDTGVDHEAQDRWQQLLDYIEANLHTEAMVRAELDMEEEGHGNNSHEVAAG